MQTGSAPADPSLSPEAAPSEDLVRMVAARRGDPYVELELRLGSYVDGRFVPGVPRDVFEQLESELAQCSSLDAEETWTELVDYHYVSHQHPLRTRVEFDVKTIQLQTSHVVKEVQSSLVLRGVEEETGRQACRVACASERPQAQPPQSCVPTHVRIKQRRVFRDVRDGKVVWSYELSKTWSAASRSAVEQLQHHVPPTYEVECELVDQGDAYLGAHSDAYVAESILLKAQVLLGEDSLDAVAPIEPARKRTRRG